MDILYFSYYSRSYMFIILVIPAKPESSVGVYLDPDFTGMTDEGI